jgi:hypothetical protein
LHELHYLTPRVKLRRLIEVPHLKCPRGTVTTVLARAAVPPLPVANLESGQCVATEQTSNKANASADVSLQMARRLRRLRLGRSARAVHRQALQLSASHDRLHQNVHARRRQT